MTNKEYWALKQREYRERKKQADPEGYRNERLKHKHKLIAKKHGFDSWEEYQEAKQKQLAEQKIKTIEHAKEQRKKYRETHKEQIALWKKRYREKHKEQIELYNKNYTRKDTEEKQEKKEYKKVEKPETKTFPHEFEYITPAWISMDVEESVYRDWVQQIKNYKVK